MQVHREVRGGLKGRCAPAGLGGINDRFMIAAPRRRHLTQGAADFAFRDAHPPRKPQPPRARRRRLPCYRPGLANQLPEATDQRMTRP